MNPNSPNKFFGIKVSKSGIPVNQASDKQLIYKDDYSTKTYYDATNSRMIEGKLPDGTYGLWVSKPGYDVTTATASQLVFNSSQDILKVVSKGTITVPSYSVSFSGNNPVSFSTSSDTINHNLGFVPIIVAFVNIPQGAFPSNYQLWGGDHVYELGQVFQLTSKSGSSVSVGGMAAIEHYTTNVSTTQLYFSVYGNVYFGTQNGGPWTISYYLLQESAS